MTFLNLGINLNFKKQAEIRFLIYVKVDTPTLLIRNVSLDHKDDFSPVLTFLPSSLCVSALNYENVVETGSETEEEDKLLVSEEDPLINGTGSPASLTNPENSPRAESHGLLSKEEEDDEMRDSGVEHIWPDNDMLSASVDGTGECPDVAEREFISLVERNLSGRSYKRTYFQTIGWMKGKLRISNYL